MFAMKALPILEKSMNSQHEFSYQILLLIAILDRASDDGIMAKDIRSKIPMRRRSSCYILLNRLVAYGIAVHADKTNCDQRLNRFLITEKGRRYARQYRLHSFLKHPDFVPYTTFS